MKPFEEEQLKEERKRDILVLVEHLLSSQETTAKLVLGSLYDIGYLNLINQKIPGKPLKFTLKSVAKLSKSAFLVVALIWFKANCPRLIANYLYSLVNFEPEEDEVITPEIANIEVNALPAPSTAEREVVSLRRQVNILTTILVGAVALIGGGVAWLSYSFKLTPWELLQLNQSAAVEQQSNSELTPHSAVIPQEKHHE